MRAVDQIFTNNQMHIQNDRYGEVIRNDIQEETPAQIFPDGLTASSFALA